MLSRLLGFLFNKKNKDESLPVLPPINTYKVDAVITKVKEGIPMPLDFDEDMKWEDTELIRKFEGCVLKAYPDPATGAEPVTIGWGNTTYSNGSKVKMGDILTQETADKLLLEEASKFWNKVESLVSVEVSRNQLRALTSFAYNVGLGKLGGSTLLKLLNAGKPKEEVALQFLRWNKANGAVMKGLTRRREAERDLFLS